MSDIISFAEDLLEALDATESKYSCSSNSPCDSNEEKKTESIDSSNTSTLHLIHECLPFLKDMNEDEPRMKTSSNTILCQDIKSTTYKSTSALLSNEESRRDNSLLSYEHKSSTSDQLTQAARKKLKKRRDEKLQHKDPIEDKSELCTFQETHTSQKECQQEKDTSREEEEGIDRIGYKCLEVFMNEVEEFNKKIYDIVEIKTHSEQFANFVNEKYIILSLDLLPRDNKTVIKVRRLISNFISKCRTEPVSTIKKLAIMNQKRKKKTKIQKIRNGWHCVLCGHSNISLCKKKCDICGRLRGFRPKDYSKDIMMDPKKEDAKFLTLANGNELQGLETEGERQRRHYLYSKRDFEIDCRMRLKSEVSELIESIRSSTFS